MFEQRFIDAICVRLAALEQHYSWIDPARFDYFRTRLVQAPQDARYALDLVLKHCRTRDSQERAVQALAFKLAFKTAVLPNQIMLPEYLHLRKNPMQHEL